MFSSKRLAVLLTCLFWLFAPLAWATSVTTTGVGVASSITTWTLIASTFTTGTSAAIDTTGANLIVITQGWYTAGTPVPTDNKSNTYTGIASAYGQTEAGSGGYLRLFYDATPTVGTSHTFTAPAGVFSAISVLAFKRSGGAATLDQSNGTVNPSPIQPGSITPTTNYQLIIGGLSVNSASTPTINSGFSSPSGINYVNGSHYSAWISYLAQTTAAAVNPTWSSVTGANAAAIASFK